METFSREQLKILESTLEDFKITRNIGGKDYTFYDENRYYKSIGALNEYGAIIYDSNPPKYIVERNKLDQLYKLQGKREYAQKMEAKRATTTEKKTIVDSFMSIAKQTPDIYDIPQDMLEFHGLDKPDETGF